MQNGSGVEADTDSSLRNESHNSERVAIFVPSLRGGGAERVMLNLAKGFASQGLRVDLVLAKAEGQYLSQVPPNVRVVSLGSRRVIFSLPSLINYLRRERPQFLLSAASHANIMALWARSIARVSTRVVVSAHSVLSKSTKNASQKRAEVIPFLISRVYPRADAIVAVSEGVAKDLNRTTGLPLERIQVIYNPVVTPDILVKAKEALNHPWFLSGEPPVILGAGRLTKPKDFPTLIRAFALVRQKKPARLIIIGEGPERPFLKALIKELGLEKDVEMPGFAPNPYAFMSRAAVFVLASAWEAFGNVLAEAMACGTTVVATDCEAGPREILEGGRWGQLVPVGNTEELAKAILTALNSPISPEILKKRGDLFSLDKITGQYLKVLYGLR